MTPSFPMFQFHSLHSFHMRGEPLIGDADQLLVEGLLPLALLVAADQHDRLPLRIEGEGEAPEPVEPKPQLLHVRERGPVEGCRRWGVATKVRTAAVARDGL